MVVLVEEHSNRDWLVCCKLYTPLFFLESSYLVSLLLEAHPKEAVDLTVRMLSLSSPQNQTPTISGEHSMLCTFGIMSFPLSDTSSFPAPQCCFFGLFLQFRADSSDKVLRNSLR